jgi:polygalacturonase
VNRASTAPTLPAEPVVPPACATLLATKTVANKTLSAADESTSDAARLQSAIDSCGSGRSVRLVTNSSFNAFLSGPLTLAAGVTLWIDAGVTLFASRNPRDFDVSSGTCGTDANDSSSGCKPLIAVKNVVNAGVVGKGTIDGRGGEPMIGGTTTWWDVAQDAKTKGVSHSNPRLIDVSGATNFTLYQIRLQNSPKFHVGLGSAGFVVWGVTIQTPSSSTNSLGQALTPVYARNTDGIDPSAASNGYIVYSNISTGDDQIAIKGGSGASTNLVIAHDWFGTGHGMSIGSETNAGVSGVTVYDLSIDGTLPTGGASGSDSNGIRIKSDKSRGGLVTGITYSDICMRGLVNPILLDPNYSSASGSLIPSFQNVALHYVRQVAVSGTTPNVTLDGYDASHLSTVTLDNVVIDGITSSHVQASYATVTLGPDPVDFTPSGTGVTVKSGVTGSTASNPCTGRFVPVVPPGDTQPPAAPSNLAWSNTGETVTLSWSASSDDTGVASYELFYGNFDLGTFDGTSVALIGFKPGTPYTFTVEARDAAGNVSVASNAATVLLGLAQDTTPPTAPTNLTASNVTASSVALRWTASTDDVGVVVYQIYAGPTLKATAVGSTSAALSGLAAGTTYSLTVKALDAAGNASAASAPLSVTTLSQ